MTSSPLYQIPDYLTDVYSQHCEIVCSFGGVLGLRCEGWENAEFIEIVWEDTR
ncbi:MAG: hypothetical protein IPL33_22335 [Sphingobacteriales bacterium]|nr:hypothetical protein [Sphingobacteriales bacterium]